jgi:hypothetical protein
LGFLYVGGHVRAYHGKHSLPKAHVPRMRIAMPATTDYWVADATAEPLFLVTAEANAGLVEMLPRILAENRPLIGERRVTVVFDRGGWSPKLFDKLIADGFDILTYRKGASRRVAQPRAGTAYHPRLQNHPRQDRPRWSPGPRARRHHRGPPGWNTARASVRHSHSRLATSAVSGRPESLGQGTPLRDQPPEGRTASSFAYGALASIQLAYLVSRGRIELGAVLPATNEPARLVRIVSWHRRG